MGKGRKKCLVKTWVAPYEKARIASNAKACGMSMSSYVRTVLSGSNPLTKNGLGDLKEVFKLHGDLGRLGGLLKMFLTNDERLNDIGKDMANVTIDNVLLDIRITQDHLKQAVAKAFGKREENQDKGETDSQET